jgi:hypothetical protein
MKIQEVFFGDVHTLRIRLEERVQHAKQAIYLMSVLED